MSRILRRAIASRSLLLRLSKLSSLSCGPPKSVCHDTANFHFSHSVLSKPDNLGYLISSRIWLHTTSTRRRSKPKLNESAPASSDDIDSSKPADYDPSNFDSIECRSLPSEKVLRIVDEITNLTLLEASDLSHLLKKKMGLPDSAMPYPGGGMAMVQGGGTAPAAAAAGEKKPEKTTFDVKLEKFDAPAKIKIIKEVRTFTALGLKEAKELVEKTPVVLKNGVTKEEAEQIIEKIKAAGGTAVME